jgi:hypothetical protein
MANYNVKHMIARACEFITGLVFVVGAVPKAMDINRFSVQMSAYHVITDKALLPWFALATLFAEMALGVALLLGLRLRGLTVLALELMLAVFTGLILYAWLVHGLEDCGCFPLIKMSPPVSIAKNVVLFLLGLVVWQVLVRRSGPDGTGTAATPTGAPPQGRGVAVRFVLAFVVAAAAVGYAAPRVEHIAQAGPAANQGNGGGAGLDYGQFVFDTDMGSYALGKGVYLVPILSMTCEDCMGKVPLLNELMSQPGMPPMVALCYEDKAGDLDNFRNQAQPLFPLHALGDQPLLYFNLRGEDPFRLTLVRDGRALMHWDGKVPRLSISLHCSRGSGNIQRL